MDYTIDGICKIVQGTFLNRIKNHSISSFSIDSRQHTDFSNTLFFAIKGQRHDGHQFIESLYNKGVRNFIVSKKNTFINLKDANFIVVLDVLEALQRLAIHHRKQFQFPVIGITGSNGKTVVKEWLFQLLYQNWSVIRSPKSYNSQVGVPLSVLMMDSSHSLGIFEGGISMPNEMEKLSNIIMPEIGILTNIKEAHAENFKSRKDKIEEKIKLFSNAKTIIYGKDDEDIEQAITLQFPKKELVSWSVKSTAALTIENITKENQCTFIGGKYKAKKVSIKIPFTDAASIENAITCWLTLLHLNQPTEGFENLSPIAMRLELKTGKNNCILINDTYNSDLASLKIALDYLNQQHIGKEKVLILSDITQNEQSQRFYEKVNKLLLQAGISRLIGVGPMISQYQNIFNVDTLTFLTTEELLNHLFSSSFKNKAVLIKGARDFQFQKVNRLLEHKVHQTVLEINLNHLVNNLNHFKALLEPNVKIMVMVKAFSYGAGTYEVANILEHHKVDYLAVAYIDEGVALRKSGVKLPIMVMNPETESFSNMIQHQLEPEIYSLQGLKAFIKAIQQNSLFLTSSAYPIHLKIETGMHRLGFEEHELPALIDLLKENPIVKVASVFSHLVASEEKAHDGFTQKQLQRFKNLSDNILKHLEYPSLRHILNSNGIVRFNNEQLDMVRLGIGLYGICSEQSVQQKLLPVGKLKTTISQLKFIPKNETVGYGRKGQLEKDTKIATIPIGYADGLNRLLSNGNWFMKVKGKKAPIVGNVCMDMTMIDVSDIDCEVGDEVVIFDDVNAIKEMAEKLNSIPYEVLTSISTRVRRVFYYE